MALNNLTGNNDDGNNSSNGSNISGFGGFGSAIPVSAQKQTNNQEVLSMLINYNDKFKTAGTILFRDNVIKQTLATLICKNKPNPLLIGQAGVGKTKIAEDIAYRLANDDKLIPDKLKGFTIYELPIVNVVSGSNFVGQLEQKVQDVIEFVENKKNKAILFIDEIHQICDDQNNTYEKIAQILKPALARGDFHCIGFTTLQESTNLFKDPAFNRRFSRVIVDELTQAQTFEVLKHSLNSYLKHYNNKFSVSDNVLEVIAPIADQYVGIGSHRPDNALTLLDRTIASEILARKVKEVELTNNLSNPDPMIVSAAQQALQAFVINPIIPITESKIKNTAINLMKGNAKQDIVDFAILRNELVNIKGQDDIIEKVLKIIRNNERGLFPRQKPVTILFTGTSGVGKTEITKIIAENITGKKPISLNMTEYSHDSAINQIIGSNIGYIGSESKIELPFDCLESNPFQFILLDEFEKGHKEVQRLFMKVFDEGVLKTNRGTTIDFSKAIIIATTNAANKEVKKNLGFGSAGVKSKSTEINELKEWFDTELINRFEHIINFNTISEDTYIEIIETIYAAEIVRIRKINRSYILKDAIDPDDLRKMRKDYVIDFGARPALRIVQEYIENQL